ncbi:MAG: hypothetical protein ACR2L8_02220 [Solirubrobacteraceae bacterium]
MTANRVLIVANEVIANRPAGVPEAVVRQILAAKEVHIVAPALTTRLESWTSDIDAAARAADERMSAIVTSIGLGSERAIGGTVGDEDPLQAIADALATFPADALILATHTPEVQNRRERRVRENARVRFGLPVTEMLIDGDGRVVSVHEPDDHA